MPPELQVALAIITLAGGVLGIPAIVAWFLNRKNANKKLQLDEGTLDVSVFDQQRQAYSDLLAQSQKAATAANDAANTAQRAAEAALREAAQYKKERQGLASRVEKAEDAVQITNTKLDSLRTLFLNVIKVHQIILTKEQQDIFDNTIPTALVRQIKRPRSRRTAGN